MKKVISLMLIILLGLNTVSFTTYAISINDPSVILTQPSRSDGTCYFTACLNMFRRRAIIDGLSDWNEITHDNYRYTITTNGTFVRGTISNVKGMNGAWESLSSNKKNSIISRLSKHPEGIVIHSQDGVQHAVLLTRYDSSSDTFYCIDTLYGKTNTEIPLQDSWMGNDGASQSTIINRLDSIVYISNRSGGTYDDILPPTEKPRNLVLYRDKGNITKGDSVRFDFTQEGATYWYIDVTKNGNREHLELVTGRDNYTYQFNNAGTYEVWFKTANDAGWTNKYCTINVFETPRKPDVDISADKTTVKPGETVHFKLSAKYADYYYAVILQNDEQISSKLMSGKTDYSHTFSKEGEYRVAISAANNSGGWSSKGVGITVSNSVDISKIHYNPMEEITVGNKTYMLFANEKQLNWDNCQKYCEKLGGNLAIIESKAEQRIIEDLIGDHTEKDRYFIGGSDIKTEGTWRWVNGERISYTNWKPGEPNNDNNEDALAVYDSASDYMWVDVWDNQNLHMSGFICEIENEIEEIGPTKLRLNKRSLSLTEGDSQKLTVSVEPEDAKVPELIWRSSNTSVATVSASGRVTAHQPGNATVTVKSAQDSSLYAECDVTVLAPKENKTEEVEQLTSTEKAEAIVPINETENKTQLILNIGLTTAIRNGEVKFLDAAPKLTNGRTMIPIRFVAESLGATVGWNDQTQTVTLLKNSTVIFITLGQNFALINGNTYALDVPAYTENGRTYLPLRFVSEALGANVDWEDATQKIIITQ